VTVDLGAARERWLAEKSSYERLLQRVKEILEKRLRDEGLVAHVTGRPKDYANLLKKMLKKGYGYEKVTDKAAARVIVRFRHEVETVLRIIEESFSILRKENKAETLGHNIVGYSGIHYDVRLKPESARQGDADLGGLQCEIQVHTLCLNLWASMDHELSYKPAVPVPEDLKRQIYLLNALLEIADRSFDSISNEIARLPGAYSMGLLHTLEQHFYRFTGETYDSELSRQVIDDLAVLYDSSELDRLSSIVENFVEVNASRLESLFNEYKGIEDRPLFLFQPEAFLILERLDKDPHVLEEVWTRRYPREELERLGVAWGRPLD
jgi:ppGpp synthetase/RelA/SpoT-type nucleotidyltranferase